MDPFPTGGVPGDYQTPYAPQPEPEETCLFGHENGWQTRAGSGVGSGATTNVNSTTTSGQSTPFSYPCTPLGYSLPRRDHTYESVMTSDLTAHQSMPIFSPQLPSYGASLFGFSSAPHLLDGDRTKTPEVRGEERNMVLSPALTKKGKPIKQTRRPNRVSSMDLPVTTGGHDVTSPERGRSSLSRRLSAKSSHQRDESRKSATFLTKLYQVLETPEYEDMIRWDASGSKIIIDNPAELEVKVLPLVYKQTRFASFSRQLNIYGFMREVRQGRRQVSTVPESAETGKEVTEHDASQWSKGERFHHSRPVPLIFSFIIAGHLSLNRGSHPDELVNYKRRVPPRLNVRKPSVTEAAKDDLKSNGILSADCTLPHTAPACSVSNPTSGQILSRVGKITGTLPMPRRVSDTEYASGTRTSYPVPPYASGPALSTCLSTSNGFPTDDPPTTPAQLNYIGVESRRMACWNDKHAKEAAGSQTGRSPIPFVQPVSTPASTFNDLSHNADGFGSSKGTDMTGSRSSRGQGITSVPPVTESTPVRFNQTFGPTSMSGIHQTNLPAITYLTHEVDRRSSYHVHNNVVSWPPYPWPRASSSPQVHATEDGYVASFPGRASPVTPSPDPSIMGVDSSNLQTAWLSGGQPPLYMQRPRDMMLANGLSVHWQRSHPGLRNADVWQSIPYPFTRPGYTASGPLLPLQPGFRLDSPELSLNSQALCDAGALTENEVHFERDDAARIHDDLHDEFIKDPDRMDSEG